MSNALVTGAAAGIGAAIAERLRADGLEVTTLDRAEGCDLRGCRGCESASGAE